MKASTFHVAGCRVPSIAALIVLSACTLHLTGAKPAVVVRNADLVGGASPVASGATDQQLPVSLAAAGAGVKFSRLAAGSTLAIRYGSTSVGTISVKVNDQPSR